MMDLRAISKVEPILPLRFLDVAGGTGDVGFRIAKELSEWFSILESRMDEGGDGDDKRRVVICDINPEMLEVGKSRVNQVLSDSNSKGYIGFVEGNAECLPFDDNTFDFYTIAFGLRNVTNKDLALKEAYRVLRKGGRLLIMEFSQVQNPILRSIYDQYSFNVIPKLGGECAVEFRSIFCHCLSLFIYFLLLICIYIFVCVFFILVFSSLYLIKVRIIISLSCFVCLFLHVISS